MLPKKRLLCLLMLGVSAFVCIATLTILPYLRKPAVSNHQHDQVMQAREGRGINDRGEGSSTITPTVLLPLRSLSVSSKDDVQQQELRMSGRNVDVGMLWTYSNLEPLLNYSRCQLSNPFKIFFYNVQLPDKFSLNEESVVGKLESILKRQRSITVDPGEACMFLAIVGPTRHPVTSTQLQAAVHSLPYWNSSGQNHILIEFSKSSTTSLLSMVDTGTAIVASSSSVQQHHYHILIPPLMELQGLSLPSQEFRRTLGTRTINSAISSIFPIKRLYFVYFEGQYVPLEQEEAAEIPYRELNAVADLVVLQQRLQAHGSSIIRLPVNCRVAIKNGSSQAMQGEWALCRSSLNRFQTCYTAIFSLVLGGHDSRHAGQDAISRLVEALRCGSVPVVVGVGRLPFGEVINWHKAAIVLPYSMLSSVAEYLTLISTDAVLEYRKQGKFLLQTYFMSDVSIMKSIIALLRSMAFHLPPLAEEVTTKPLLTIPGNVSSATAPPLSRSKHTVDVYSEAFWNSPPSPFYMYPVTPFRPPQITILDASNNLINPYEGLTHNTTNFDGHLHGNYAEEGFTLVTITYHRTASLLDMIKRFQGCPFMVKVVVIWNGDDDPPPTLEWPRIGVPIEVVTTGQNSLNNRFLPLASIETEAVLSIDDDVMLSHSEINFAFRIWRENRDRLVGWSSRHHNRDARTNFWVYSFLKTCETSMVLTNAAFIHKYYFYLYTTWMPEGVKQLVDKQMNCEDIAMNFLVSHISRKPPIKVGDRRNIQFDYEKLKGLSKSSNHFQERDHCMNVFASLFGYMPLLHTQYRVVPFLSGEERCFKGIIH